MEEQNKWTRCKQFVSTVFSFYTSAEMELTSVAVAYYMLVSLFPILLTLANLLPYFPFDIQLILGLLADFIPERLYPMASSFVTNILTQPSTSWLGISILTTLWTLSRSMIILQKAFNKAYGINEHRDFVTGHLIGIFLGISLQILIILSITMLAFGHSIATYIDTILGWSGDWLKEVMSYTQPLVYVTLFVSLMLFYFVLPNVKIKKVRYVLPGTLFVLVTMFSVGQLFTIYVNNYATKLLDFRMVTAVIFLAFMVWFILIAQVLIMGAVLNASVQFLHVREFQIRDGNIVSIMKRVKKKFFSKTS